MGKVIDHTGQRFGRLTVIERTSDHVSPKGKTYARWICCCDCGKIVTVVGRDLRSGHTKSCGCFQSEVISRRRDTHHLSQTRIYRIWSGMKNRCNNPKCKDFAKYGGRGITVCDEWQTDVQKFYEWAIANGYQDDLSIDRIDNSKGYSPDNCRWATKIVQNRNTRANTGIEIHGEIKTLAEWCEQYGKAYNTVHARITRNGWSPEEALEIIPRDNK